MAVFPDLLEWPLGSQNNHGSFTVAVLVLSGTSSAAHSIQHYVIVSPKWWHLSA